MSIRRVRVKPEAMEARAAELARRERTTDVGETTRNSENAAELVESLADVEHTRWSDWQRYLQEEKCEQAQADPYMAPQPGELIIGKEDAERWARLIATPYQDLPEHSKQSDRDQVARQWPLWVNYVTDWLIDAGLDDAAQDWQEEMQWPVSTSTN